MRIKIPLTALLLTLGGGMSTVAFADPAQRAQDAVDGVLFELDIDQVSYSVRPDGYVDLIFGKHLPEERYRQAIAALRTHPDIPGILAGRDVHDLCPFAD